MRPTPEYETRVVIAGQEYHAQTAASGECLNCALWSPSDGLPRCITPALLQVTPCTPPTRADRTSIIWVKA